VTSPIRIERREAVGLVILDRPERMNALSRDTILALGEAGRKLQADAQIRAVIVTGEGERAFSAGADLKERLAMDDQGVLEMLRSYRSELDWLSSSRFPTIAAINGVALGGGLELALTCDLRVARAGVILGLPETALGIIPGAGGTQRLPRLIGEAKARELILLGSRLTSEQAFSIGLVNHVCSEFEDLIEATLAFIRPIREGAPIAQAAALRALRAATLPLEPGLAVELEAYSECLASEDRREALLAFQEKRPPKFCGR
jgi:enoyl-CoA hydratase/carnithine racemase